MELIEEKGTVAAFGCCADFFCKKMMSVDELLGLVIVAVLLYFAYCLILGRDSGENGANGQVITIYIWCTFRRVLALFW